MEYRKERACRIYNIAPEKVESTINKTDKTRANYYNFYTSQKWNNMQNYDLCVNSAKLGEEGSVALIKEYVRMVCERGNGGFDEV